MNKLRLKLKYVCKCIRLFFAQGSDHHSNRLCAALMNHLEYNMPERAIVTTSELHEVIKNSFSQDPKLIPFIDRNLLIETCKNLGINGHLLFLSQSNMDMQDNLLIINEGVILSKVHICLIAIKKLLTNTIGILDENKFRNILSEVFKNTEKEAVISFIFPQICIKIATNQLTSNPSLTSIKEKYCHFFPSLVDASKPTDLLTPGERNYTHLFTWCLKCTNVHQFFTPRFLHALSVQSSDYRLPKLCPPIPCSVKTTKVTTSKFMPFQ